VNEASRIFHIAMLIFASAAEPPVGLGPHTTSRATDHVRHAVAFVTGTESLRAVGARSSAEQRKPTGDADTEAGEEHTGIKLTDDKSRRPALSWRPRGCSGRSFRIDHDKSLILMWSG